jgi:hypothetical protein
LIFKSRCINWAAFEFLVLNNPISLDGFSAFALRIFCVWQACHPKEGRFSYCKDFPVQSIGSLLPQDPNAPGFRRVCPAN